MLDTPVRNGRVAFGNGDPRYPDDSGIDGKKRVVDVPPLGDAQATMTIDAIAEALFPHFAGRRGHTIPTTLPTFTAESTTLEETPTSPRDPRGQGICCRWPLLEQRQSVRGSGASECV